MSTKEKTKTLDEILAENDIEPSSDDVYKLILWNDDVNSFDWVILCLMDIMSFTPQKAESVAMTVHLQNSCVIKNGSKDTLKPFKRTLEERGLSLSIEKD